MTVGSIISGGFGLIRRRPGAVAVWGLIYLAVTVLMGFAMRSLMGSVASTMSQGRPGILAGFGATMGQVLLIELAALIVLLVIMAATQRAVLHPEREDFAYLRLGMDELRLVGLGLILLILTYIGVLIAGILLTLLAGIVAVAAGPGAAVPVGMVEMLIILGLLLWIEVRLSLAFPLTMLRGKIIIGESWRVTKGRFWTLFGAFLILFLILLVLWIAVALVTSGGYFADLAQSGFTPQGMQAAGQRQMERQFGAITPLAVLGWVLTSLVGTLNLVVFGGAIATAARELVDDPNTLADTFA
ncbi:MAG: hypothetical protein ACJ8ER_12475 [Allosphingosinicella sp.]